MVCRPPINYIINILLYYIMKTYYKCPICYNLTFSVAGVCSKHAPEYNTKYKQICDNRLFINRTKKKLLKKVVIKYNDPNTQLLPTKEYFTQDAIILRWC
jgi:hypothetical protein